VLYSSRLGGLPHSGTFRGNQMALHLGAACLEHLFTEGVLQNVLDIERFWHGAAPELRALAGVVAVRSVGGLLGVEFDTPERSEVVFEHLLEHGVLCKRAGRDKKTLVFWMMLNLTEDMCAAVFAAVKNAIVNTGHSCATTSSIVEHQGPPLNVSKYEALGTSRGCPRGWPVSTRYEEPVGDLHVPSQGDVPVASEVSIRKVPCGNHGDAHLLSNVFSPAECRDIIEQAISIGLERLDLGSGLDVSAIKAGAQRRGNSRVALEGALLSKEVWRRIGSFFPPIVISAADRELGGWAVEPGVWRPVGLGDVWRIARYHNAGDSIGAHYDDYLVLGPNKRSLKTFNVNLTSSDPSSGGFFNFLSWGEDECTPQVIGESIVPTAGSALAFDDHLLHEGAPIAHGEKWLLRSEIVYELVPPPQSSGNP